MTAPSKVPSSGHAALRATRAKARRFPVSDGAPVEVVEDGPSIAARVMALAATLTIKPTLTIGSLAPRMPWPWGAVDFACRVMRPVPGTIKATISLPNCTAQIVRAPGVLPADGKRSVILYAHGGAFLTCGANSHGRLITALSKFSDSPVLVVNYRMIPKNSVGQAIDDCYDGYQWLRDQGYEPDQIVLAGDSAGGYLSLALAERLHEDVVPETPAAVVTMSPLFELDNEARANHPNVRRDAMFPARAFHALVELIEEAATRNIVDGRPEEVYEPLDHIEPGLPRTLIHVSGSEVLISDARKAARLLAAAGVPVEVRVWPGQMHVFQLGAPLVSEAQRSLKQIGEYIREATW
ncbi:alpha/beta hydrolase [Mycolicibacterium sp. S2-37]|uniref:alpha/beta hydrolase fold domain-containing protein n=1 Tax=Mycolicibacterium sp. S2-37 TaxID=2810297 RepID=UPI001A94443D|nr:alpha/beta hydrolase [Mycolicibacterium sp. S2-37]MBO0679455.1 alpha/beta hydrolase [Mycolicibacterium sp. S2-37]